MKSSKFQTTGLESMTTLKKNSLLNPRLAESTYTRNYLIFNIRPAGSLSRQKGWKQYDNIKKHQNKH